MGRPKSDADKGEFSPGTPAAPERLVEYQAGSIVSRTLVKKPTGSVTLFAFDQGQSLSEHVSPYDALVHVLDGEGRFLLEGRPVRVAAGEMLLMPADRPHAVEAEQRFKMSLTMIRS